MARYAGFVRAVMIGREGLTRQVLLDLVEGCGGADPASYISTGNATFTIDRGRRAGFVADLEMSITEVVGRDTQVFVRSIAQLATMVRHDPFGVQPFGDEARDRIVTMTDRPFRIDGQLPLVTDRGDMSVFAIDGKHAFTVTRLVDGRFRAPGGWLERLHGSPVTSRAWSTIERIVAKESARATES